MLRARFDGAASLNFVDDARGFGERQWSSRDYALTKGLPGELNSSRCNFAVSFVRSVSAVAFSRRFLSCTIFSLRVRRRRISGRRLGADIIVLLNFPRPSSMFSRCDDAYEHTTGVHHQMVESIIGYRSAIRAKTPLFLEIAAASHYWQSRVFRKTRVDK